MSSNPSRTINSASPILATVIPLAPDRTCIRAMSGILCVFVCGLRLSPWREQYSAISFRFLSRISRSTTTAGVSSSLTRIGDQSTINTSQLGTFHLVKGFHQLASARVIRFFLQHPADIHPRFLPVLRLEMGERQHQGQPILLRSVLSRRKLLTKIGDRILWFRFDRSTLSFDRSTLSGRLGGGIAAWRR